MTWSFEADAFDVSVEPINADVIEHHCFGCGNQNPIGLRLRFRPLPDGGVWADFTPTRDHEGYLSMTHGGILATILDEGMSWAVTHTGDLGVTARMSMSFRKPARVGRPLRVLAHADVRRGRTIDTRAAIVDAESGELLAEAQARFVRVSKQQAAAWREQYGAGIDDSAFGRAAERNAGGSLEVPS